MSGIGSREKALLKVVGQELVRLERRVADLEVLLKFSGPWDAQKVYSAGVTVQHDDKYWRCVDTCVGVVPGWSSTAWQQERRGA